MKQEKEKAEIIQLNIVDEEGYDGERILSTRYLINADLAKVLELKERVVKRDRFMPKKAAVEAIAMFEMSCGPTATAHDVFMAMQEIPYNLKIQNTPESKMLSVEENMARALTLNWKEFDLATGVDY